MNDKLGQVEHRLHIYENISKIIINRQYIEDNYSFFEKVIFKLWEDYDKSVLETISITKQIKMFELYLSVMLEFKPSLELPEDYI
jgi:hypothetical protein